MAPLYHGSTLLWLYSLLYSSTHYHRSARGTSASTARSIARPIAPMAGSTATGGPTFGSRAAAAASSAAKARCCAAASSYVEDEPGMAGQPLLPRLAEASRPKELLFGHPLALVKPAHPAPLWPKHGGPLLSTQASLSMASSISWSPRARRGAAGSPSAAATPQSRSPPRATGETGAITWPTQRWERWCPTANLG